MTSGTSAQRQPGRPTVVIVDDERSARLLVRTALELSGLQIVAEADSAIEAIRSTATYEPDIVILDQMMPGLAGHESVSAILATSPSSQVVLYTSIDAPDFERDVVAAGAAAVVSKTAPPEELARVVEGLIRRIQPRCD